MRKLLDEDTQNNVVMMEQNVKTILGQAADAIADVGRVFDDICPTDIYLLSIAYHLLMTIEIGLYTQSCIVIAQPSVFFKGKSWSRQLYHFRGRSNTMETKML